MTFHALLNVFPSRYDNLLDVRVIPAKKDIAFVEYMDERSATVAKEALHNYKIDGENKIKVCVLNCLGLEFTYFLSRLLTHANDTLSFSSYVSLLLRSPTWWMDHCTQIPCLPA